MKTQNRACRDKQKSREHMTSMRTCKTPEQSLQRQAKNREHMTSMRTCETPEQSLQRQEKNREHMMKLRGSETPSDVVSRKQANKEAMANRRSRSVPVEHAIAAFHSEVKSGPDFVCTCCYRMMYRRSVVNCNKQKYIKASTDILQMVFSDQRPQDTHGPCLFRICAEHYVLSTKLQSCLHINVFLSY